MFGIVLKVIKNYLFTLGMHVKKVVKIEAYHGPQTNTCFIISCDVALQTIEKWLVKYCNVNDWEIYTVGM